MEIFRKIIFYKRALQFLFALNVLTIASGVSAGLAYYGSKKALMILTEQNMARLTQIEDIQKRLFQLANDTGRDPYATRYHLESLKLQLEAWPDANLGTFSIADVSKRGWRLDPKFSASLFERTQKEGANLRKEIDASLRQIGNITRQMVFVGLITLVFGIGLPALAFWGLHRAWQLARQKVERSLSRWLVQWHETWRKHGERPWADSAFWLNVILLTLENFAPKMRHPAFQFLGEFAPVLRKELQRVDTLRSVENLHHDPLGDTSEETHPTGSVNPNKKTA